MSVRRVITKDWYPGITLTYSADDGNLPTPVVLYPPTAMEEDPARPGSFVIDIADWNPAWIGRDIFTPSDGSASETQPIPTTELQLEAGAAVPAGPITWPEAKVHLRLDTDADQSYVESLIAAAVDYAETRLAAALNERTVSITFYDGAPLILRPGPVTEVISVLDAAGAPVTYETRLEGLTTRIYPTSGGGAWPLTVNFTAQWTPLPPSLRLAILQHVATMYENRESASDRTKTPVPHSLEAFYRAKSRDGGIG